MKMKYLYQISALLFGMFIISGCVEWPQFEASDLESAPTVSVAQSNVSDSTITVEVTTSSNGFVAAILLPGTGNEIPDSAAMLEGNVDVTDYMYSEAEANTVVSFTFKSDIEQNSSYEVMAVGANADGVVSTVAVVEITTTDSYAPNLVGTAPAIGYSPVVNRGDTLILGFDEAVMLGAGKFSIETYYTGQTVTVPTANVWAMGSSVYIILPADFPYREYLWLHWEAGAVKDASGNNVSALTTYFDGDEGAFVGVYWRMVAMTYDVASVAPDVATAQAADFDIVLTYDDDVDVSDVADGDITITYDDGAGIMTTVDVPAADVSASGSDVTIAQTVFSSAAGTVTVDVPEGIFGIGIGNPNAEFSATWDLAK